jgi:preprotein translocase subunit SecA
MSLLQRWWAKQRLGRWRPWVSRIEAADQGATSLTDVQLQKASLALRYRVLSGEPAEQLLVPAYGLVRQAARRALGMSHFPVQLLGGIALHHGAVAVMQTGEGKTLTATLPLYLAALAQRGAHLITANDYLAERDARLMGPLFELLGLRVGLVTGQSNRQQRQAGYAADVTYATAKEVGFDFLRDRLTLRRSEELPAARWAGGDFGAPTNEGPVQRDLHFALVDEADSILIDEARTPLIVSSPTGDGQNPRTILYRWATVAATELRIDQDYVPDVQGRRVQLTASGRRRARQLARPTELDTTSLLELYQFLEQALAIECFYQDGRQYVVAGGEVQIVDEFTGRVAEGRKWRAGLHQALEARHGLHVTPETGESARITLQDLFLRYHNLAGMTGTVAASGPELKTIYRLWPVEIPTNRPPRRQRLPDRVLRTAAEKWAAIADEVAEVQSTGRPVLIGTRSIELSRVLSQHLAARQIAHQVLNATQVAAEAAIIAEAGQGRAVTVATNMAGRGTDIQLSAAARQAGGLHVICSELHESARIDRQLIGRCGRQGDPGSFRHFHCWEDDILISGCGKRAQKWRAGVRRGAEIRGDVAVFYHAQRKVERRHFQARCQLLYQEGHRQQLQREMGQDPYLDTIES